MRTAPEAPVMPAPGELGPGRSAVPSVPLHGPVDVADDSLEGLQSAFRALSVEEVDTNPMKRKREREKRMLEKGGPAPAVPLPPVTPADLLPINACIYQNPGFQIQKIYKILSSFKPE